MKLMDEVTCLEGEQLKEFIRKRAELIVRETQGSDWDDPEEWQAEAAELAHAVIRLLEG